MILDIHNHPYWYSYTPERFLANMDEYGIDVTCLLSWESPADEYDPCYNSLLPDVGQSDGPISFRSCVEFQKSAPERFLLGYGPDPRRADSIDRLLWAKNTYGIKLCGELKYRMVIDNPDAIRLYRVCGRENLPVLLHLEDPWESEIRYPRPDYWYGGGIGALERALRLCPDTVFIGHAPGFWAYLSGDQEKDGVVAPYANTSVKPGGRLLRMLDEYPNLYCDTSAGSGRLALARDPAFAAEFLEKYSTRVLFGRDCFDNGHREILEKLGLSREALENIYCKNAEKLLGLTKK